MKWKKAWDLLKNIAAPSPPKSRWSKCGKILVISEWMYGDSFLCGYGNFHNENERKSMFNNQDAEIHFGTWSAVVSSSLRSCEDWDMNIRHLAQHLTRSKHSLRDGCHHLLWLILRAVFQREGGSANRCPPDSGPGQCLLGKGRDSILIWE